MTAPPWYTKGTVWCAVCIVCLVFVGIALFAGSWASRYALESYTHHTIIDTILVDSPSSPAFDRWRRNYGDDRGSANLHQYFIFCNVTNVEQVLGEGALPVVQEVGPYAYWQKRENIDISFLEGGDSVSFNTWTRYEFLSDMSNGTEADVIHSINPAYLGALALAGGELQLLVGATGPSIKLFFDFLWSTFVPDFVQSGVPDILGDAEQEVRAHAGGISQEEFLATWANQTSESDKIWAGMLVSASSSLSSGISYASAQALFNATEPSSLLDPSWNATQLWRRAIQGDLVSRTALSTQFILTDRQLDMVCSWLSTSFYDHYVFPNVTALWGVESVSDLAYLQWGMGLLSQESVSVLYSDTQFPATPELALYWRSMGRFGGLDLHTSKQVLSGPYGVFEAANVGLLIKTLQEAARPPFNSSVLYERWGLIMEDAFTFGAYFAYMTAKYATYVLGDVFAEGGGLYTAKTVHEWLWEDRDPLLEVVAPNLATKSVLIGNETSPDEARERHNASVSWTGKRQIDEIGVYIEWQGTTSLHGVYAQDIPVVGVNNMGQFAPFLDLNSKLYAWDNYYLRTVTLVPLEMVEFKGVHMIRYLVDNATWAINNTLYNGIPGFANLTGAYYGASVFLSNPHMLGANLSWPSLISGFPLPDPARDVTLIDLEPNSGVVAHYDEGLEINVYLDPKSTYFNLYSIDVKRGYMLPLVWTRELGLISDQDAEAVRNNLYFASHLTTGVFWATLSIGALLLLLAVPALFVLLRCSRKDQNLIHYRPLNLSEDYSPREDTALDELSS